MNRIQKMTLSISTVGILAFSAMLPTSAFASTSGVIIVNVNQTFTSAVGTVIVTGAIADYGTIQGSDVLGNPSHASPAPAALLKLKKGSIVIDNGNLNKATSQAPFIQNTTCSFSLTATAVPWDIIKGSGAYQAIKGTLTLSANLGGITPKYKTGTNKGKCDFSNKYPPVASFFNLFATGSITA
jgi:hypothetical protein